jgi:hypothetical protein
METLYFIIAKTLTAFWLIKLVILNAIVENAPNVKEHSRNVFKVEMILHKARLEKNF